MLLLNTTYSNLYNTTLIQGVFLINRPKELTWYRDFLNLQFFSYLNMFELSNK